VRNAKYNRNATCPFYQTVLVTKGGQVIGIACESLDDNLGFDVQSFVRFRSKRDLDDYFGLFCSDLHTQCPYYKAIYKKYDK